MSPRQQRFDVLTAKAAACRLCPRMADQPAVLGAQNGPLDARIVFVAEAPGRLGAGRTGIPFSGDKSGENFETLLAHAGLTRRDVFITNAALCNPLNNGSNRPPTASELKNCAPFLTAVLEILEPGVVVSLGRVGFQSLNRLLSTKLDFSQAVCKPVETGSFTWLPLFHPSPRVTNWRRPLPLQKRDFRKIPALMRKRSPRRKA